MNDFDVFVESRWLAEMQHPVQSGTKRNNKVSMFERSFQQQQQQKFRNKKLKKKYI